MKYKKLRISIFLLVVVILFGTIGYSVIEGMTLFDSFYMTLITISTVGFSEIAPLTQAGRLITVFIIISGISLLTYTLGQTRSPGAASSSQPVTKVFYVEKLFRTAILLIT